MVTFPDGVWDGDSGSRDSDLGVNAAPTKEDWLRMLQEIQAMQNKTITDVTQGTGTAGIIPGLSVHESGDAALHRTLFVLENVIIPIVDAGAAGAHGSLKIYTYPKSYLNVISGHLNFTSVVAGVGGIANGAHLDIAVGTVTTSVANETLATTEQDITTKDDVTLTGGSGTAEAIQATIQLFDGSSSAIEIFLNTAIEAASCSANDTLTVSGRITILWYSCDCPA